jgi:hypothetical protein
MQEYSLGKQMKRLTEDEKFPIESHIGILKD